MGIPLQPLDNHAMVLRNVNNDLSFFNNIIPCGIPRIKKLPHSRRNLAAISTLNEVKQLLKELRNSIRAQLI